MKIFSPIKTLLIFAILIIAESGYSQVVVERSKDRVVISGVPYFIHQVKKGETVYSISRAYGITIEDLTKENPPIVYGLKEGQALRIPVAKVDEIKKTETTPLVQQPKDETKFIYHTLKPGETIFYLSKYYGVSENEILQSNPGIDITKLSVGTEIAIPRRDFMTERQKFDTREQKYFYHKVIEGESLASIARMYGLPVRVLRRENRDLRFPGVGDYVRVPGVEPLTENAEQIITDTAAVVAEEPLTKYPKSEGFTPVKDLQGSLNVAVLLPFYLKENSVRIEIDSSQVVKGKKIYKMNNRKEDWIYPGSIGYIEMYNGILLAADTLRSLGVNLNLYTFDIKSDTIALSKLINQGKLDGMDLILGPVYSHNLSKVAAYAKNKGIPVVSPVTLMNNSVLSGNPTLFMPNSSLEVAQRTIAKKVSEFPTDNFVFIHTDSTGNDASVGRFKNMIFNELNFKIQYDDIKFKEFIFYSRSMFDNDSINRLSHALSDQSENIIIIASEEAPVISETLDDIYALSKKFKVKVFCYPVIRDLDNLDLKELFDLDMLVYSPYWIDYSRKDIRRFNSVYRSKFLTEPTEMSYAWQGYDITYYFISGLALHGKDFISHPEMHNPDLLQTEYEFVKKWPGDGFENQKLFPVRYTKDYEVKLVDEDDPFDRR
jgi:LysM repeat protein